MYKKIYRNMCFLSMLTLLLATVMILSVCYATFNTRLKDEIKNEALFIADFLKENPNAISTLDNLHRDNRRITLIAADGTVLYDNDAPVGTLDDHSTRPEIQAAAENGFGEAERYSMTLATTVYYYAIRLPDGSIVRLASTTHNILAIFFNVLMLVLFIAAFIYIFSIIIAGRLTDNIVKPIERMQLTENAEQDGAYEELKPFLTKITRQGQEIRRQMERVKAQKIQLQTITDNMNEGLVVVDQNGTVLAVNNCVLTLFQTKEELVKNQSFLHLTRNVELNNALNRALQGEKNNIDVELSGKTYQVFYSPVRNRETISGVVMLLFDVSVRARAEQIRREFSANVSHELKTPLTTILGYAQLLRHGIAKPEDMQSFIVKIEKESARLITLIDDIMKLSKLDEDVQTEKQEVSLRQTIGEVLDALQTKADEQQVSVSLSGGDFQAHANGAQLTELFYNLCDNAIKYNRPGGTVTVSLSENRVTVADTGIGIPEEYLDRIFERFFRVDKSHSKQVSGTGLGLSIVKHIAQANDISIQVSSRINEGTAFTLTFHS